MNLGLSGRSATENERKTLPKEAVSFLLKGDEVYLPIRLSDIDQGWIGYKKGHEDQTLIASPWLYCEEKVFTSKLPDDHFGIFLPTGAGRKRDSSELYDDVLNLLSEVVKFPDLSALKVVGLYTLSTWNFDRYSSVSYLAFTGEPGCGKSAALSAVTRLVLNGCIGSGCDTNAAILRIADQLHGTMALDEAQRNISDPGDAFHKLLAMGNQRDGVVRQMEATNSKGVFKARVFKLFGPKIFSGRYLAGDEAILSRTYEVVLPKLSLDDLPVIEVSDPTWESKAQSLRNDLSFYRQRRMIEELTTPNLSYQDQVRSHGFDARDLQVYKWLLDEAPTYDAVNAVIEVVARSKTNLQRVKSEQPEALILYAILSCLKDSSLADYKRPYFTTISERMNGSGRPKIFEKTISKVVNSCGFPRVRDSGGNRTFPTIERVIEELAKRGLELPEEFKVQKKGGSS